MNFSGAIKTFIFVALLGNVCFADSLDVKIIPNGSAAMDVGEVVNGYDKNAGDISWAEYARIFFRIGLDVRLSDKTKFDGSMEVKAFNEFPRLVKLGGTRRYYYYYYLHQAELKHQLMNDNGFQWDIGGGYFPYKYNPDARNLGEYMFRSTAYPQTITTEFEFPYSRLAGVYSRSSYTTGDHRINLDLILNTNTEWVAIGDVNLSLIASYNFAKIVELGAGVEFGSIISADEKTTTPKSSATQYLNGTDTSQYYTFRGTKVMGRLSIDPKKLLPYAAFGDDDLKLYTEAAILGTKDYGVSLNSPVWYNSILERIPVMVGFNVPWFKILDVFSVEAEWWGNRYPNSMQGIVEDGLPLPFLEGTKDIDSTKYKNDNYKWSVYAAKTFARHYRISCQVASDHMRTFAWDWNRQDWEESLRGPDKMYFVVRFGIMF